MRSKHDQILIMIHFDWFYRDKFLQRISLYVYLKREVS